MIRERTPTPGSPEKAAVRSMFDRIAPRYDLLNRLLSAGVDRRWRRASVDYLALPPASRVLDVCTGTADLLIEFLRRDPAHAGVGVDLSGEMLVRGARKLRRAGLGPRCFLASGDAERLPLRDGRFDGALVAFGIRNVGEPLVALREIHRVLRPGGRALVMLYAENSLHYWRKLVWRLGIKEGLLDKASMGEIMSRTVERSANDARPLVKVYTKRRAEGLFEDFCRVEVLQRQLLAEELPAPLRWVRPAIERRFGWNLIVKATKHV